jgi:hypothetical protein
MLSETRLAILTANRNPKREILLPERGLSHCDCKKQQVRRTTAMKGSITFKFSENVDNYSICTLRGGSLDSRDLEAIVALIGEEIRLQQLIAWGEITPTPADPTGTGQLHVHWSN